MRLPVPAALVLLLAVAVVVPACGEDEVVRDTREVTEAYYAFRDAILQGDDEAFFRIHGSEARQWVLENFPSVRAEYMTGNAEQKEAFRRLFRVSEEEFLRGDARAMVVKMMPWKSGCREQRDLYRTARLKDVKLHTVERPDGTRERRGVVELEPPGEASGAGAADYPTVEFVKEKEGWRRRYFFLEAVHVPAPPVAPPRKPGE